MGPENELLQYLLLTCLWQAQEQFQHLGVIWCAKACNGILEINQHSRKLKEHFIFYLPSLWSN